MEVMDRRGGCCIARYGCDAEVAWKLGRILLRYRPIAPKPTAADAAAPGAAPDACGGATGNERAKRKGAGREGRRGRKARKVAGVFREDIKKEDKEGAAAAQTAVVTLPLMSETPERKEERTEAPSPTWKERRGEVVAPRPVRPAASWVTVERVTGTWREEEMGAWCSDEAVRRSLEGDASPGFVSDEWDRVTWTNAAYQRMVDGGGGEEEEEEVRVALETRGMVPGCRAFTCGVTVRYSSRRRGRVTMAAPCDVWRLGDGGLAWRLDLKAALSLSLES